MSMNTPDTAPFDAFATSLLKEMLWETQGFRLEVSTAEEVKKFRMIVARRAADLVAAQADNVEALAHKILLLIGQAYSEMECVSTDKAVTLQGDLIDEIETLCKQRTTKDMGGVQSNIS